MQAAMKNGANGGIGLVRTESMILNNYDEDRQVMEYRRMLENETKSIRKENIEALCQIFGCSPNDLFSLDGEAGNDV